MSKNTTQTTREILTTPGVGHQTLLTSFRRNGAGVASQVGTRASGDKLYFMTPANTWKVKRLAHNPHVTLAPCSGSGKPLGPAIEGNVRRLSGEEVKRARALLRTGLLGRFWNLIFDLRYPGDKTAVYEITLVADELVDNTIKQATQYK